ncbi:MAG TPA: dockerin type I repeat-containing protein [Verrucomicrobiae bacterium]|nr:dockerin type I repeat-containing protein [Verrucomicrobiae bacterium]
MRAIILFIFAVSFGLFSESFALPKSKVPEPASVNRQPAKIQPARPIPIVVDDDVVRENSLPLDPAQSYRYLGPRQIEQSASPYVDVRVGIPETPGGNNHMRRQVALSPTGTVHMVYGIYDVDSTGTPDSARNFFYFYNAYDCGNSNALRNGSLDVPIRDSFPPTDLRPRFVNQGGLFIPPGTNTPVVYGNQYILLTDTPPLGDVSFRGCATMRDSAECLGMFSMDTTMNISTTRRHPVNYPLNESVWVATYRAGNTPNAISFTYTTDRGLTWSADAILPTYSPWFNSVEITGRGNTVYVVSMADPNDPNAFTTTERPCYLKGTYNPATGALTWGTITDITGDFELPGFLGNMIDISAIMVGDVLHVLWTDWNNFLGAGGPGPGGHVHHAAVFPDGTVQGPHKITDINVDGRLPDRSGTLFGFAVCNWPMVSLAYDTTQDYLFALWSAPPDDGNYGWGDYEQYGVMACYDIFTATSPYASYYHGIIWDDARNVTQTNNPGCDGSPGDPCHHEDQFEVAAIANDTLWVVAMVQRYPGFQETAVRSGITPDPGPFTEQYDVFRLYKVPARYNYCHLSCGDLGTPPGDTTKFYQIQLQPRGGTKSFNLRLVNISLNDTYLDSVTLDTGLNDGYLVVTTNAVFGTLVTVGGHYDFQVFMNTDGVGSANIGARSGLLKAYTHYGSPPSYRILPINITVYVVPTLCLNRKTVIHSATNHTEVGNQGSIKDQGGLGMYYPVNGHDNFYDGGVWVAWDNNIPDGRTNCADGFPRKVTRQLFGDKYLRCLTDAVLDSVPGTGSYYNLYLKSIAAELQDSTIVWQNIWEQSTHPDSSDFLIQTTRIINIGNDPIDSVAMGVIYDLDVQVDGVVSASENVGGDTTVSHLGRTWWLGWVAGNDVVVDTCAPGAYAYGFVVVPGTIGNPGDFVGPRGAVVYQQAGFSYNIGCENPNGGDSLFERYAWNLVGTHSTENPADDTLTGVFQRCLSGNAYRRDMGYMTVAKKVYNLPPNGGGNALVARYGLDALAAAVDTFFSGPGETYTIIHVASSGGGLAGLMNNAVKGIDWYVDHSDVQVGTSQTRFRGDLNNDGQLSPADVVLELNYVFSNVDMYNGTAIPLCVADLNNTGDLSPADIVLLLNGTFTGGDCLGCLKPCF